MSASQENIVEALQKKIRERMNEHADHLSTGGCQNFEEYRHMTGIVAGLALAERDLIDLLEIATRQ